MPARIKGSSAQASPLQLLTDDLLQQESVLREGGGTSGQARQKKLGRLTVRERIDALIDKGADFFEVNLWAAWQMYSTWGDVPAAGVVCGIGNVQGRPCMVIANDATVKAGAFFPATAKKVLRAQRIAHRSNIPLIYLVDSAGVFLPMQDEIFPDEDDFGRIFRNNAVLSAVGVPQIAAIMGNCVAGGAYLPVLCDKILMTEGSALYLAGPSLVKAAIGQEVDEESLGGAAMHAEVSGTVDFREADDPSCIKRIRSLIALLPETFIGDAAQSTQRKQGISVGDRPALTRRALKEGAQRDANDLYSIVSPDGRTSYDAREVLACIADAGSINEYKAETGLSVLTAYASIAGRPVGVVANQHQVSKSKSHGVQLGGVIYSDSADKAARFVMDCSQNGLPLVFFQDVVGFMVGRDAEQSGIIRSGAKLVSAVSNAAVPKITVIVGGSFGAGNYAMCGKAFDPHLIVAWPNAKYAVMGGTQAAGTLLTLRERQAKRGDKTLSDAERDQLRQEIEADYTQQTDIRYGAARGWVDAIIQPHQTRQFLINALAWSTRPPPPGGFRAGVIQV